MDNLGSPIAFAHGIYPVHQHSRMRRFCDRPDIHTFIYNVHRHRRWKFHRRCGATDSGTCSWRYLPIPLHVVSQSPSLLLSHTDSFLPREICVPASHSSQHPSACPICVLTVYLYFFFPLISRTGSPRQIPPKPKRVLVSPTGFNITRDFPAHLDRNL